MDARTRLTEALMASKMERTVKTHVNKTLSATRSVAKKALKDGRDKDHLARIIEAIASVQRARDMGLINCAIASSIHLVELIHGRYELLFEPSLRQLKMSQEYGRLGGAPPKTERDVEMAREFTRRRATSHLSDTQLMYDIGRKWNPRLAATAAYQAIRRGLKYSSDNPA
jgi:hypothetical protein